MENTYMLAQRLITLPSYVGGKTDERQVGLFIYNWLTNNTNLTVIKQQVAGGRFNVIALGEQPITTLIVGHMDTVEPRAGWETDPFKPTSMNGRLYGLGATDMKGSLAAGLISLTQLDTKGLMFLAYCDEEYDFAGMRSFIQEWKNKIQPKRVISLDGCEQNVGNGCRGLIEVSFQMRGKTGHAGRPELGINAIVAGMNCITKLKRQLATKYADPYLGITTLNLAYCQGGLDVNGKTYGKEGNNIPDLAEFVLDIRPATSTLTANRVKQICEKYAQMNKLAIENWRVRHDLGAWVTKPNELTDYMFGKELRPSLGYIDVQMLWEAWGGIPCCTIGAGNLELAHKPNEYVEVEALTTLEKLLIQMIKKGNI